MRYRPAGRLWSERLAVVGLAVAGLALALRPVGTILEIATETFTGLAALFPVLVGGSCCGRTAAEFLIRPEKRGLFQKLRHVGFRRYFRGGAYHPEPRDDADDAGR